MTAIMSATSVPLCRYDDLLTSRANYDDYATTLLDTIYGLPAEYAPPDLVSVNAAGLAGPQRVRSVVIGDLAALAEAARSARAPIGIVSAYRSYYDQVNTFARWVRIGDYEHALRTSARPGHSEHQLGTALDFQSAGGGAPWRVRDRARIRRLLGGRLQRYTSRPDWATTRAGAWMEQNAWHYGFVMSYPRDRTDVTCYQYEPWHYRYVGRDLAARIHASGLTTREFLWDQQPEPVG